MYLNSPIQIEPKNYFEKALLFTVSFLAISIFFTKTGISVFGLLSTSLLIIWRYLPNHPQRISLPKTVFVSSILFFAVLFLSSYYSENSRWAFREIGKYRHLLIAGLLFTAPLRKEFRKALIIVFFISAAFDSVIGMLQYVDILPKGYDRPHGYATHPILYAADLAFVCGTSLILLVIQNDMFTIRKERLFLLVIAILTFVSIVLSESRGVWVALVPACAITLFFYDRKKTIVLTIILVASFAILFAFSPTLKNRAVSIGTSIYNENESGSTGNRLELWKGALLMFRESPVFGTGYGDFEPDIKRLINEGKIKNLHSTVYAHNIFFQSLATRGIIGLAILITLIAALLKWGWNEIHGHRNIGGYIIILSTLLTIMGGLTENNIEIHRFLAAYCFTLGLMGQLRPVDV